MLNNITGYVLYRKAGWVAMEQDVDVDESSWKWAHLSSPVDDGELWRVGALGSNGVSRNQRLRRVAHYDLHGDRINNQYSIFTH